MAKAKDCEFARSEMTPCVRRDGPICYAIGTNDEPICVGCERPVEITGVPAPEDWAAQVARAKRPQKRKRAGRR